jgi:hypothetical protein
MTLWPLLVLAAAQSAVPATIDGLPLGGLPRQALPAQGCAAYLFTTGQTRVLAAMAGPASLRLALDGVTADYPRVGEGGAETLGLPLGASYRAGDVTATLDMTIARRSDLTAGAMVPQATLRIDRTGRDTLVVPLAGLVGCRT